MDSQNNSEKTEAATEHKVDNSKILSIIAYIGPLVIISYLMSKESEFAKFHTKQGLILFAGEVALWVVGSMIWMLFPVIQIINLGLFVLSIIGIVNAAQGKEKQLPLVGHFANSFKI